ncbi:hypothetical protein Tco_1536119, partial [Tanacetum coccineum]
MAVPESSSGNLRGLSSSDKSFLGNDGEMTLQSVYDLCISLCTQVSDQAKEIQHLKAQIKKLKKQAKTCYHTPQSMDEECLIEAKIGRKEILKEKLDAKEIPEDTLDNMKTEDAQGVGRTRDVVDEKKENVVDEEKENVEDVLSTEDVLSIAQQKVSTDKEKVCTDIPIVSTDRSKVSTDKEKDSTDRTDEGTDDQTEGGRATQTTQTHTSTIFGDDETIAQPLPKIDPKDKGKKKIEEEDESESESDGIPEAEKKFKQLASDEEMARKVQEEWEGEEERKRLAEEEATNDALIRNYDDIKARIEADRLLAEKLQEEEREQFTIEERAKFLHDTIAAQRKFLAQQRSEAIRNRPPTKNQL